MKVNFKRFKLHSDVKDFFEKQLPLGITTPDKVFAFLDDLGLKHSQLLDNSQWIHKIFDASGNAEISPSPYEQHISSIARARPTLFLFTNRWMLYFHFNGEKLAEIEVEKADVSF